MPSLDARIDVLIEAEGDFRTRLRLELEKACYLARVGSGEASLALISSVERSVGRYGDPVLTAQIMVAEGLLNYFGADWKVARDRLLRANAISANDSSSDAFSYSAAWLAQIDFSRGHYGPMFDWLVASTRESTHWSDRAIMRVLLTLADCALYCGLATRANQLYELSRQLAVDMGDQATLAAIMFNRATLRLARCRLLLALNEDCSAESLFLDAEIDSAEAYFLAARHSSLEHLIRLLRGRRLLLQGEFSEAYRLLAEVAALEKATAIGDESALLQAELSLCLASTQQLNKAREAFSAIQRRTVESLSLDDKIIFLDLARKLEFQPDDGLVSCSELENLADLGRVFRTEMDFLAKEVDAWAEIFAAKVVPTRAQRGR